MSNRPLHDLIRGLRRATRPDPGDGLADADLLQRWLAHRDGAAFEVLVWRHGPMVLGLCRRLLRDARDVEDAFQATFLALARKAGALSKREAVGSWLYKVAYRTALRARTGTRIWQALDPATPDLGACDPEEEALRRDLRAVLDEELNRLPARYRAPLVLCYFEGKTNEEAARELGCAVGTVASRLARGRQRLRGQLIRRGLAPTAGLLALALPRDAAAAVPAALVASTARVALQGMGSAVVEGAASAQVIALTEGVLRAMWMTKLKFVTATVLVIAAVGVGGAVGTRGPGAREGTEDPLVTVPRPAEKPRPVTPPRPTRSADDRNRAAEIERARDLAEQAVAQLAIERAKIKQAEADLSFGLAQLARFRQLAKRGAVDAKLVAEREQDVIARKARVAISVAELKRAELLLRQAQRRLSALQRPAKLPRAPVSAEKRLRELEKKFDALRRELDDLKQALKLAKPRKLEKPGQ